MPQKPVKQLTDGEALALSLWITANGRSWRSKLLAAFEICGTGIAGYTPELQQIRNRLGPAFLAKLETTEVLKAGATIAEARKGPQG